METLKKLLLLLFLSLINFASSPAFASESTNDLKRWADIEDTWVKNLKWQSTMTVERKPIKDCHGMSINEEFIILENRAIEPIMSQESLTEEELFSAKIRAHEILTKWVGNSDYLNSPYQEDYAYLSGFLGLTGLRPYEPFASHLSLSPQEAQVIISYWREQYKKSNTLQNIEEKVGFSDRYPTTEYWVQTLVRYWSDTSFSLLVNRLLMKLDSAPSSFYALGTIPWWKDNRWQ